jgi:hypothetical protein
VNEQTGKYVFLCGASARDNTDGTSDISKCLLDGEISSSNDKNTIFAMRRVSLTRFSTSLAMSDD